MKVRFDSLIEGQRYSRAYLSDLWKYKGKEALYRGCIVPKNTRLVILFYTDQNRNMYKNSFDGYKLTAEGEHGHSTDYAKVAAYNGNKEVHLFYRNLDSMPFTYFGQVKVTGYSINIVRPSVFEYALIEKTTGA